LQGPIARRIEAAGTPQPGQCRRSNASGPYDNWHMCSGGRRDFRKAPSLVGE
jgi:hypothetical protein